MNTFDNEKVDLTSRQGASIVAMAGAAETANLAGCYSVECVGADGKTKWFDKFDNLVTTIGKNLGLDTILAGSAYTATVVMGLKGTGTAVVADTQSSHASWSEVGGTNAPAYSGTRKTPAWSSASGGSKATSSAVSFTFSSGGTVAGCFLNINGSSTLDSTTGTLYSAGDFSGGSKTVANGDTLNVTYTGSM